MCDRFGFSLVSIDAIVVTFYNVFPELGMHAEPEKSEPIVSKFIFEYMRQLSTESPNRKFVIEGCHIQPATVVANTDCEKYDVVCMGYPGLTPEQFLLRVRGTNWAVAKNDAEIIQMGECFIARSVGYGALKIMSDAEIEEFKARYITYLATERDTPYEQQTETANYGFKDGESINTLNAYANNFIYDFLFDTDWKYYRDNSR